MDAFSRFVLCAGIAAALLAPPAAQARFQTLHSFTGSDGSFPSGGVIFSENGRALYGTAAKGGPAGDGTVFRLDLATGMLSTLHSFTGSDGATPYGGVIIGRRGMLYGTTEEGGTTGNGTVFKLDPKTGMLTTLHNFIGSDGASPYAGLTSDGRGVLYGTTLVGGANGAGAVFQLDPATGAFATLYSFTGSDDGDEPWAALTIGHDGALYGTNKFAGASTTCEFGDCGTVFRLDPKTGALDTLYSFSGSDGLDSLAPVVFGKGGVLLGTTSGGGIDGYGTIFTLDAATGALTTLHSFVRTDGNGPVSGMVFDGRGLLYGTTDAGGAYEFGVLYKFAPKTATLTVVHSFTGGGDGAYPWAGVIFGRNGAIYGAATAGGANNDGTLFRITP